MWKKIKFLLQRQVLKETLGLLPADRKGTRRDQRNTKSNWQFLEYTLNKITQPKSDKSSEVLFLPNWYLRNSIVWRSGRIQLHRCSRIRYSSWNSHRHTLLTTKQSTSLIKSFWNVTPLKWWLKQTQYATRESHISSPTLAAMSTSCRCHQKKGARIHTKAMRRKITKLNFHR